MEFSAVLASMRSDGHDHRVTLESDWQQGRATFGGLIVALANQAMRKHVPTAIPLRGLQTAFVEPAHAGELQLRTQILRQGKSVTAARCDLMQDGTFIANVVASYGLARTSPIRRIPAAVAPTRAVDDVREVRYVEGVSPTFAQYFAHRFAEAGKPGSGGEPRHKVYVHHRESARCDEAHLIAIADAVPSPAGIAATVPTRGSSLLWTLEIIDHDFDFTTHEWWRIDTDVQAAVDGYINETSIISNPQGNVAAIGHQIVTIF